MKKVQSNIIIKDYIAYATSTLVIAVSTCLVLFLPVANETKTMFSLPGIAGLFSLLVQGWRDQVAHERARELQQRQNDFDLAIASHMANVVFDKQVEFCEKYSQKLYAFIPVMLRTGPSKEALDCASELQDIRLRYSPWISLNIINKLTPYESALREIGSLKMVEESYEAHKHKGLDPSLIDRMYKISSHRTV